MYLIISYEDTLRADEKRSARWQIKHVALPEQTLGAVFIKNDAAVDLARDLEGDATRDIRFDHAGDHIRAGCLCGDDHMHSGRAGHLCDTCDRRLDVCGGGLH